MQLAKPIVKDKLVRGYLECLFWSEMDQTNDQGCSPLEDNYSPDDLAPCAMQLIEADCAKFLERAETSIPHLLDDHFLEQIGHDFWLTRNGHGAGFWDGDYDKAAGDELTRLAREFGTINAVVGDDGLIYLE